MLNSLDLLIIVFIAMVAIALIGLVFQFISKNSLVQKIGFFANAALAAVLAFCNFESTPLEYGGDIFAGFAFGALAIAAVIFQFVKKDEKSFSVARILAAVAVLGGLAVTFLI